MTAFRKPPSAFNYETDAQHAIRAVVGARPDVLLLRNQVGLADYGARGKVPYGLAKGSGDLIGIHARIITEADVGHLAGVFLSVEVKSAAGRPTEHQLRWANLVRRYGGIAMVARGPTEVEAVLGMPLRMPDPRR
jgi:hypothetical protein